MGIESRCETSLYSGKERDTNLIDSMPKYRFGAAAVTSGQICVLIVGGCDKNYHVSVPNVDFIHQLIL